MPTTEKLVPKIGIRARFVPRRVMNRKKPIPKFKAPLSVHGLFSAPQTTLPVDSFGPQPPPFEMDGNDTLGICGPAMCRHVDVVLRYRMGRGQIGPDNVDALIAQYEQYSGGDNGTDEDMLVGANGMWTAAGGGLENDPTQIVDDHLDIDVTDQALTQYAIDNFFTVQMAWSVPDAFLNDFQQDAVFMSAGVPDPNNGHYVPLANVYANGAKFKGVDVSQAYTLITWGATCVVGPAFVASVQPQSFVAFSRQQFDPTTGLDAKGRHVSTQADVWVACGGDAGKAAAVVALFPAVGPTPGPGPKPGPTPGPTPIPGPTPTPVPDPTQWPTYTGMISSVPGTVTLTPGTGTGGSSSLKSELEGAKISPNIIADVLKLVADMKAKAGVAVILADLVQIAVDFKS
jgi:hypothetical protein